MEKQVEQPTEQPSGDSGDFDSRLEKLLDNEGITSDVQQTPEKQGEEQAPEQPEQTEAPTPEALEEIDFEGETYQVPPKLKAAFMRQQDYTQKTQTVAQRERMVALHIQRQEIEQAFQQAVQPDQTSLYQLEAAIKQYEGVNWPQLDMESYIKTKHALESLEKQRDQVKQGIDEKRKEFGKKVDQVGKETRQRANEYLSRSIPKWGPDIQNELMAYGETEGYTDVELASIADPRLVKTLWKAQQYDKLHASRSIAANRAKGAPPVIKPSASRPVASVAQQTADAIKQLHQAKDPARKDELFDKALDLKLGKFLR